VAFSPDGTVIAAGHSDGKVWLWDVTTGTIRVTLDRTYSLTMAYSPDGAVLASASFDDSRIWLWDTASGQNLGILENDYFGVTDLAYSPDGATLAAGFRDEGGVVLWDTASRQVRRVVADNTYISQVAFSPDGSVLVSATYSGLLDRGRGNGSQLDTLEGYAGFVTGLVYRPDGAVLASSTGNGTPQLWDSATGHLLQTRAGDGSGFLMSPIVRPHRPRRWL
jgi:WD40 repeat protein